MGQDPLPCLGPYLEQMTPKAPSLNSMIQGGVGLGKVKLTGRTGTFHSSACPLPVSFWE